MIVKESSREVVVLFISISIMVQQAAGAAREGEELADIRGGSWRGDGQTFFYMEHTSTERREVSEGRPNL